jgi:hypothetical protein
MRSRPSCIRTRPAPFYVIAALAAFCTIGCTIPTRVAELDLQIPKSATPVAIQAGIDKMDDPATQLRIAQMMARPEMRAVQREMVAGLVDGTLQTLGEGERSARIDALVNKAITGMLRGASRELTPMAKDMTRNAMNGALDAALDPGRRANLESSVGVIVSTSVRSAAEGLREANIGQTVSAAMTDEIGPAFEQSMRDSVAPALAELLKNEDFRRELGETARVLGREMVLGATDALAEKKDPGDGSLLSRISGLASQGARLFGTAAWLFVLVIVALVVWVIKLNAQTKRYRNESRGAGARRLLSRNEPRARTRAPQERHSGALLSYPNGALFNARRHVLRHK